MEAALYSGLVTHRRSRPRRHELRYRVFYLLLDLDRIDAIAAGLRSFGHNRFNLMAFHDRDHLDGSATPLRRQVEDHLARAGIALAGGAIMLLTMPRVLGYVFNPLSLYFCHHADGRLLAILYEVNNTFGQRHCYLIPVAADAGPLISQHCDKHFYVSPFLDMDLAYAFQVAPPGRAVSVTVTASDRDGQLIATCFAGRRQSLSDATLLRSFLSHPLLTLKVVAGIHWEALKIWRKGIGLRPRPPAPANPVTIVPAEAREPA